MLSTFNPDVNIQNSNISLGDIKMDSAVNAKFKISVSPTAVPGSSVEFIYMSVRVSIIS